MKKSLLLALIILVGWSCQKDQEQLTPVDPVPEAVVDTKEQIPIEKIFYHKATEQYIYQKGDPYSFENMKRAYELLQAKRQEQFGTRAGAGGSIELTPSHYSLKIYPRNESEQWRVERMQDVMVAYLPFDYVPLPEEEAEVMSLTRSMVEPFEEEVRYTVTYDNLQSVEGPQPPVTLNMPVLYVTWPATKPLPLDLDYEIVDQLLLPTGWDDRIPVPGFDSLPKSPFLPRMITVRGRMLDWDETLQEYVPVPGLKMEIGYGSNHQVCYTDSEGMFSFEINAINFSFVKFWATFASDKWKIVRGNSTTPRSSGAHNIADYWSMDTTEIVELRRDFDMPDYEITRAMHYFYNGNHYVPKWSYDDGIRIVTNIFSPEGNLGLFTFPSNGNPAFITIYNDLKLRRYVHPESTWEYEDCDILGTILHEMGHFCHYGEVGLSGIVNTHNLFIESYASYVGWHLTTKQYSDNFDYTLPVSAIHQSRQAWTKEQSVESNGCYSPLFVDLFDSYNQGASSSSMRPKDNLTIFSHTKLRNIVANCRSWSSFKAEFSKLIGVCYTEEEFEEYFSNYDYWFSNN
uniref:hypothetical protein n=1 Tax=Alistipes sp. TaxID=1872444 RepID=UPI0040561228